MKSLLSPMLSICIWPLLSLAYAAGTADRPVSWFSTGGETVYHLKAARTSADVPRSIVAAAYSGKVLCFDFAGKQQWEQAAGRFFPFDLDVGDSDGDGFDECDVASADGSLYLDSGYLDPADRLAEIKVNADVLSATDILSRQKLDVRSSALTVTVPMGILRVIDIEHR